MMSEKLYWIADKKLSDDFPPVEAALADGLLAIGGKLTASRVLAAYPQGIFPWYNDAQPVLWWSPDPRCVLYPNDFKITKSLRKILRQQSFEICYNRDFHAVISACSAPRAQTDDTWLTVDMQATYTQLAKMGYAHSVECWQHGQLVGGLYGLLLGKIFFGESMFSQVANASKVALADLVAQCVKLDIQLLDCQVDSSHLRSLGATLIPRASFQQQLADHCSLTPLSLPA